jgi:DNA-binding response OmpR family regulator
LRVALSTGDLDRRRVLVVDDDDDVASALVEVLRLLGYEARRAADGRQALALARAFAPEIILLDIGLPLLDGYAVASELRRRGVRARLIALTGYGGVTDRRRVCDAGFDRHLVKPVDLADLMAVLREPAYLDPPLDQPGA